jgi:hypothetical protein
VVHPSVEELRLPAPRFTGLAEGHSGYNDQSDFCTQFMRKRPTEPDGRRPQDRSPSPQGMCALFALCGVYFNAQAFPGRQHSVESCALRDAENCDRPNHRHSDRTKKIRARTNVKRQGQCVHVTDSRSQKTIDVKMRDFVRPCWCDVNEDARLARGLCTRLQVQVQVTIGPCIGQPT